MAEEEKRTILDDLEDDVIERMPQNSYWAWKISEKIRELKEKQKRERDNGMLNPKS